MKTKIIFSDGGVDKAITEIVLGQDDYFTYLLGNNGQRYQIGKRSVVCIKNVEQSKGGSNGRE